MSQALATKLVSKLRYQVQDRRRLRNVEGPKGRHDKIRKTVTALLKHERIEMNYHRADESRGYAERLISEAIRHGDTHHPTMDMASYWIIEPSVVHKLFKVLVPRYKYHKTSYTKMWRAPKNYPGYGYPKCILELCGNVYPSVEPDKSYNKNLIHNVLLAEARNVYCKKKEQMAAEALKTDRNQLKVAGNGNIELDKMRMVNGESQASDKDNLILVNESEIKNEENSLEADLGKLKITEEKAKETFSENEKK